MVGWTPWLFLKIHAGLPKVNWRSHKEGRTFYLHRNLSAVLWWAQTPLHGLTHSSECQPHETYWSTCMDASAVGVRPCSFKSGINKYPIGYASKSLNRAQKNRSATKLELSAVIFAIKKSPLLCKGCAVFPNSNGPWRDGAITQDQKHYRSTRSVDYAALLVPFKVVYRAGKLILLHTACRGIHLVTWRNPSWSRVFPRCASCHC